MITGTIGIMIAKAVVGAVMSLIAYGLFFDVPVDPPTEQDRQVMVETMEE